MSAIAVSGYTYLGNDHVKEALIFLAIAGGFSQSEVYQRGHVVIVHLQDIRPAEKPQRKREKNFLKVEILSSARGERDGEQAKGILCVCERERERERRRALERLRGENAQTQST